MLRRPAKPVLTLTLRSIAKAMPRRALSVRAEQCFEAPRREEMDSSQNFSIGGQCEKSLEGLRRRHPPEELDGFLEPPPGEALGPDLLLDALHLLGKAALEEL